MGALDEGHFSEQLENGSHLGCCLELGFEEEPETVAVKEAVKVLLQGLGEDVDREGIRKTPLRVAKALREGTRGYKQKVKDIVQGALFPEAGFDKGVGNAGGVGGLVIVRDLDLFSYCESCLLPFHVKCHVGYVPSSQRVVGLSKLSRVADVFAKRLQDPQRLANEVCYALHHSIKPEGVAVVLQCSHIHFPNLESLILESNHEAWVKAIVSSGLGIFENRTDSIWTDFLSLLRFRGTNVGKPLPNGQCWCPSQSNTSGTLSSEIGSGPPGMIAAVTSILKSLGEEDVSRKELQGTPDRFIKWLTNFQKSNLEMKLNGFIGSRMDPLRSNGQVSGSGEKIQFELNFRFWSQCEHHLLPFYGVVHLGYFRAKGVDPTVRALIQSIVHFHGFKLQVQERLTRQIAETVSSLLGPDVMVLVEANHTCMVSRGIEKIGSSTATIAVLGQFSVDPAARTMFLQSIPETDLHEGGFF